MAIKALIAAEILLTLNSCAIHKHVRKENNLNSNLTALDSDLVCEKEKEREAEVRWENFVEQAQGMQDSIAQNMTVSEWPWKVIVPAPSGLYKSLSLEFSVCDPDGNEIFYYYYRPMEYMAEGNDTILVNIGDHVIDASVIPAKEGTYSLFTKAVCTEDEGIPTQLATYDYHKPEILTQINIQNGELSINQDMQGPVRIVLMNLTNNTSQEISLNQSFKQGETLNAFQYFDITQLDGKNCCLIVQDGSGQTVFEEKFYKL